MPSSHSFALLLDAVLVVPRPAAERLHLHPPVPDDSGRWTVGADGHREAEGKVQLTSPLCR